MSLGDRSRERETIISCIQIMVLCPIKYNMHSDNLIDI